MGSRWTGLVAALVLVVATGGAVALARHEVIASPPVPAASASDGPAVPDTPARTDGPTVVPGRTVYVDSGVRSTTFRPLGLGPQNGRTLTAQHAYNALLQNPSPLTPIPPNVQAYYGSLVDADASPMAVHTRVWGFAVISGCVVSHPRLLPGQSQPPESRRCRQWEFVNARTGHDLGVVSQEVLPD